MWKSESKWHFLILTAVAVYFAFSWIPWGKYIGGGDVGIPFFSPEKALEVVSSSWWETQATGTSNPVTYTAVPFYSILTLLSFVGIGPSLAQKLFFFMIILGGSLSIYLFARKYLLPKNYSFLAAFFYISNIFILTIWRRGIHNGMLFLFFAPLSFYLLAEGISKRSYYYIFLINLTSVVFSYIFGSPAYLIALWFLWLTFLVFKFFSLENWESKRFVIIFSLALILSWVGTNLWWLVHFILSSLQVFETFSTETVRSVSTDVLTALQPQTDLYYVIRGMDKYQLYDVEDWRGFYNLRIIFVFSWLSIVMIITTSLFRKNRESKTWKLLMLILVFTIFVSKGVNPPLGWLTKFLYDKVFFLTLLRNPYEKVGPLFLIPFSLLFGLALLNISEYLRGKNKNLEVFFVILVVIINSFLLPWPLWLGQTFSGSSEKSKIVVPEYYGQANLWLKSENRGERVLHLPISAGESVDYNWGYSGIDPNQLFFDGSSISYRIGNINVDNRIFNLEQLIRNGEIEDFLKAISSLDIGWVILHEEVEWKNRGQDNPERIKNWLKSNGVFEFKKKIGPLSIWKIKDEYILGRVYSSGSYHYLNSTNNNELYEFWKTMFGDRSIFVTDNKYLDSYIKSKTFFPIRFMGYMEEPIIDKENALKELPFVRHLPGKLIYPFIIFKEKLTSLTSTIHPISMCIDLAGKRLVETVYLSEKGMYDLASENLERYEKQLESCHNISGFTISSYISFQPRYLEISGKLWKHVVVIEKYLLNSDIKYKANETKSKLREFMSIYAIAPRYDPLYKVDGRKVLIFTFEVLDDGEYDVRLNNKPFRDNFPNPIIQQVDNEVVHLSGIKEDGGVIRFGKVKLLKGEHEFHLSIDNYPELNLEKPLFEGFQDSIILDPSDKVYKLKAESRPTKLIYDLRDVNFSETYGISFESFVVRGAPLKLSVIQDSDRLNDEGKVVPAVEYQLDLNNYDFYWKENFVYYHPSLNASSAKIVVEVYPWNNCRSFYSERECKKESFNKQFNRPSEVWLKEFKILKVFSGSLYLVSETVPIKKEGEAIISSRKIKPSLYELNISQQTIPYVLVFSETYHPSWKIYDINNKPIPLKSLVVNGYSNGWFIEKPLPSRVYIKFDLEKLKYKGVAFSIIFISVCGLLVMVVRFRK